MGFKGTWSRQERKHELQVVTEVNMDHRSLKWQVCNQEGEVKYLGAFML